MLLITQRLMTHLGPLMREHAARASALIPGARETFDQIVAAGLKVASSTGYTRAMMGPVLIRAAEQGYRAGAYRFMPGRDPDGPAFAFDDL